MKKIVALLLAASLSFGLITTAFADDTPGPEYSENVKAVMYDKVTVKDENGQDVERYKVSTNNGVAIPNSRYTWYINGNPGPTFRISDNYVVLGADSTVAEVFNSWDHNGDDACRENYTMTVSGESYNIIFTELHSMEPDNPRHDFKTIKAEPTEDGLQHNLVCKWCGLKKVAPHGASMNWKVRDEGGHEGTCTLCDQKIGPEEHDYGVNGICKVCDYGKTIEIKLDVQGGKPEMDPIKVQCGTEVNEPATKPQKDGNNFQHWSTEPNGERYKFGEVAYEDTAPKTLYAVWKPQEKPPVEETTYEVTVTTDGNGTAKVAVGDGTPNTKINAKEKDTVMVICEANKGYTLDKITVTDAENGSVSLASNNTFIMPAKPVTVNVTFKKDTSVEDDNKPSGSGGGSSKPSIKPGTTTTPTDPITNPGDQTGTGTVAGFSDVSASAWYADAVKYVVDRGLFGGVGNGRFAPDANMTRAMMWTVLARYKGVDTNTGSNWYEAARTWAMQQNISDGTMADGNVTREQFVTMLWRLSGEPAANNSASFTDNGRVSAYAKTAVDWAVAQGIVNGYNDGSFRPQGSATRAEVAKMLMVYCVTSEG